MEDILQLLRDTRQSYNEDLGLFCYGRESNPRVWSLWREAGDVQLTEWRDLGPEGFIWVAEDKGDELFLILEHRDDAENPPVLRQGLLHLPSGKETGLIFHGEDYGKSCGVERIFHNGPEVLFTAFLLDETNAVGMALYDRHLRQVVPPVAFRIHPNYEHPGLVELQIIAENETIVRGIYDYKRLHYVVPAEYNEIYFHEGCWIANAASGHSHIRLSDGTLVASYDYTLHSSYKKLELYVNRHGLWGMADAKGQIVIEPYAASSEDLDAEAIKFTRLTLRKSAQAPICVEESDLQKLITQTDEVGCCVKYEGIELEDYSDGYVDVSVAELPAQGRALLLEDRDGDLRLLILTTPWRKLPVGSVLRLHGKSSVSAVLSNSTEDIFLQSIFAQSVDFL